MKSVGLGFALGFAMLTSRASAQQALVNQNIAGTRLDVVAAAEVTRVPDVAIVSAGVISRSTNAASALGESSSRIERMTNVLRRAGVSDSDIQTSDLRLNPEYRYPENEAPQLVGYSATNTIRVRLRDLKKAGPILDALVAQGANQINGPVFTIDRPDEALDEARVKAIALGRARADLYAHSLGLHVTRVVSVNETEAANVGPEGAFTMQARAAPPTKIMEGEQKLKVCVAMTFEL